MQRYVFHENNPEERYFTFIWIFFWRLGPPYFGWTILIVSWPIFFSCCMRSHCLWKSWKILEFGRKIPCPWKSFVVHENPWISCHLYHQKMNCWKRDSKCKRCSKTTRGFECILIKKKKCQHGLNFSQKSSDLLEPFLESLEKSLTARVDAETSEREDLNPQIWEGWEPG